MRPRQQLSGTLRRAATISLLVRLTVTAALCVLATCASLDAQTNKPTEFEVKAAYLFNFGKFVKWPGPIGSDRDIFPICVLGTDPFGQVLDSTISGEHIDGKRVTTRRIGSPSEAAGCRIVFVCRSEEGRLSSEMPVLSRWPVLTVSDIRGFADHAGMIEFLMEHDRVRFEVNLNATQKAGLALSSELLKVATFVKRLPGE